MVQETIATNAINEQAPLRLTLFPGGGEDGADRCSQPGQSPALKPSIFIERIVREEVEWPGQDQWPQSSGSRVRPRNGGLTLQGVQIHGPGAAARSGPERAGRWFAEDAVLVGLATAECRA